MYSAGVRPTEQVGSRIGHRVGCYSVRSSRSIKNKCLGSQGFRPLVFVGMNLKTLFYGYLVEFYR